MDTARTGSTNIPSNCSRCWWRQVKSTGCDPSMTDTAGRNIIMWLAFDSWGRYDLIEWYIMIKFIKWLVITHSASPTANSPKSNTSRNSSRLDLRRTSPSFRKGKTSTPTSTRSQGSPLPDNLKKKILLRCGLTGLNGTKATNRIKSASRTKQSKDYTNLKNIVLVELINLDVQYWSSGCVTTWREWQQLRKILDIYSIWLRREPKWQEKQVYFWISRNPSDGDHLRQKRHIGLRWCFEGEYEEVHADVERLLPINIEIILCVGCQCILPCDVEDSECIHFEANRGQDKFVGERGGIKGTYIEVELIGGVRGHFAAIMMVKQIIRIEFYVESFRLWHCRIDLIFCVWFSTFVVLPPCPSVHSWVCWSDRMLSWAMSWLYFSHWTVRSISRWCWNSVVLLRWVCSLCLRVFIIVSYISEGRYWFLWVLLSTSIWVWGVLPPWLFPFMFWLSCWSFFVPVLRCMRLVSSFLLVVIG